MFRKPTRVTATPCFSSIHRAGHRIGFYVTRLTGSGFVSCLLDSFRVAY